MRCNQVQQKLDLFSTEELAPSERKAIAAHLESCGECRQALARLGQLEDLLAASSVPPVPDGFAARVVARAAERQASVARSRSVSHRAFRPAWKRLAVSAGTLSALAAGVLIGMLMGQTTWRAVDRPLSAVATRPAHPLAASGFEYLFDASGNSLARTYVQLTTATDP
jgi:anti-sigma factor RsiW